MEEVGTSATYAIADSDQGKKIRAVISYTIAKAMTNKSQQFQKTYFLKLQITQLKELQPQVGADMIY